MGVHVLWIQKSSIQHCHCPSGSAFGMFNLKACFKVYPIKPAIGMNIRNKIEYSDYCSHVSYSAQYQILDRNCSPCDITTIVYKHKFFASSEFIPRYVYLHLSRM